MHSTAAWSSGLTVRCFRFRIFIYLYSKPVPLFSSAISELSVSPGEVSCYSSSIYLRRCPLNNIRYESTVYSGNGLDIRRRLGAFRMQPFRRRCPDGLTMTLA
ncbi:hypothetical protein OE88DRAFT_1669234 [Heliocybe sulcata]|uniref:Uncharacterized protein n=1 Tax=Heliocybe sulcata TaxID=5364 RepID=A0A5C3ML85_9AGAM|nr:hypothetical protein OE88DRAFT_1669234 [Heliocybe sulcata]